MKMFRELSITVPEGKHSDFVQYLESLLSEGWKRDREMEKESRRWGISADFIYFFTCENLQNRKDARLSLVQLKDRPNILSVSNIVPLKVSSLTRDEYNGILTEFHDKFIVPVAIKMNFNVSLSSDEKSIDDFMCRETAEKFRSFVGLANKSTGSSHFLDKERWYEFAISAFEHDDDIDSTILERWLVEDDKWPEDVANSLAIEFSQEIGLLQYLKEQRK